MTLKRKECRSSDFKEVVMSWRRDFDPCSDGIDGCVQCILYDLYADCNYDCKFSREEIEEVAG